MNQPSIMLIVLTTLLSGVAIKIGFVAYVLYWIVH
jgi:hypothetical protein